MLFRAEAKLRIDEPEIDEQIAMCVRAFHDAGTCRQFGFAMGPIPMTAILAWADLHGLDRETTILVWDVVHYADGERAERQAARERLKRMRGGKNT